MPAWTGRTDCTIPSVEHECLDDAEAWLAEQEKVDPEGVDRGDYFIDVLTEDGERVVPAA